MLALPPLARIVAPAAWGWLADRTGAHRGVVAFSCAVSALRVRRLAAFHASASPVLIALMSAALRGRAAAGRGDHARLARAASPGRYGPIRLWGSIGFIAVVLGGGALARPPAGDRRCRPCSWCSSLAALRASRWSLPAVAPHARTQARAWLELDARGARALRAPASATRWRTARCTPSLSLHLERAGYSGTAIGVLWTRRRARRDRGVPLPAAALPALRAFHDPDREPRLRGGALPRHRLGRGRARG